MKGIAAGFEKKYQLRGCVGPIDGTAIPMRKPSRHSVGGDSNSFWCYKGYPAILLLAMVDADGLFTYISAGAPGNVGDSGLFSRSALKRNIDDGMQRKFQFELPVVGQMHRIYPYLVGDAAFALDMHMLKIIDPAQDELDVRFSCRLINVRRGSELGFGGLKGRWKFMEKNKTYGDPRFVTKCAEVCCALHNFLTKRGRIYAGELPDLPVHALPVAGAAAPAANAAGAAVPSKLKQWIAAGSL